jgi:hypothetical protein
VTDRLIRFTTALAVLMVAGERLGRRRQYVIAWCKGTAPVAGRLHARDPKEPIPGGLFRTCQTMRSSRHISFFYAILMTGGCQGGQDECSGIAFNGAML